MKTAIKALPLICTLALCCMVFSSACSQTRRSNEIEAQIKQVENSLSGRVKLEGSRGDNILDRMAALKVKGLSIAVIKDYKIIWTKGYGWADENEKQAVTDKTMFQAASVSKSINSMGVMKLVQDKRLDLTEDINNYLRSWKFPYDEVSKGKKITTLNLLTHTAGIYDGAAMYIDKDAVPGIVQVLNGTEGSKYIYSDAKRTHSVMEPGVEFQYSNNGVGITQLIISDIVKKPYEQYMQETVFGPLEMTNSCYSENTLKKHKGHIAVGYSDGYEVPGKHVIVPMQAAGGLWTTPADLARFIIEVQLAYSGRSHKVLSQQTVKTMLTPYITEAPGFFIRQIRPGGQKYFSHSGIIKGFKSEYYGSLEGGYGVAVMINSDGPSGNIIPELINSVATVYQWKDFYEPELRKKPIAVAAELLGKCEGVYLFEDKYAVILQKPDGGHYWTERIDSKMNFTSRKEFFNIEFPTRKELIMDASGIVTGFKRFLNGAELKPAVKVEDAGSVKWTSAQLAEIAWYLLENKRYDLSLSYFKHLASLDPKDKMTKCNMAHCYLFLKDYAKALHLYKDVLELDMPAFKQAIPADFTFFKKNGFETALMDKALADLKLEVPKEYKN